MDSSKRRKQILEKKKKIHDVIKRASSRLDPLSPFDSFRRYTKNDLSVYLEPGRGDRLSSSLKQHIRKLLKNMEGFYGSDWPIQAKVKRKEMSSPDARYIFVRELRYGKAYEEGCDQIAGFVHYRFTLEEEIPVLYVYEIQLESRIQGKGLGEFLMQLIELIASKNQMSAVVLTVQTSNALAMTFYMSKLGYRISSISPSKTNLPVQNQLSRPSMRYFAKRLIPKLNLCWRRMTENQRKIAYQACSCIVPYSYKTEADEDFGSFDGSSYFQTKRQRNLKCESHFVLH
ncbi:uncharacterized protein LOC108820829 isoform X4 [Raphanus sativus]|uniref:N-alpha-acetyltransferase 40 n=1 Tax=Raphanus sativus TaxID=3726 RepID=A0A6J0KMY9_RAPSA|nr:uncharacterized protein LOC108820829 isoform X4 [Raphanus sativus]